MAGESAVRWIDLGPSFVRRVLVTTGWVGAVAFLCIAVYRGVPQAVAWAGGAALGAADLFLLDRLLGEVIGLRRRWALAVFGSLKFAAVYGVGAAMLLWLRLAPWFLLAGFSLFLVVALLKVAGRMMLTAGPLARERSGAGGPLLRRGPGQGKVARP